MSILLSVFLVVLSGYVFGVLSKKVGVPRVVGQVLGGALIAATPLRQALLAEPSFGVLDFLSDIGAIMLFFFVGLEMNPQEVRRDFKKSVLISLFNTGIPLMGGYFISKAFLGLDFVASLMVGISLAVSSQAVSLDFLEEARMLKSRVGNLIITAGAVDDLIEGVLITIILTVFQVSVSTPSIASMGLGIAVFLALIAALKLMVFPLLAREFDEDNSQSVLLGGALLATLFMAVVSEAVGVGALVGAMIAGILTRSTFLSGPSRRPWKEHSLEHLIHTMAFGFFVPIFFTRIGLGIDAAALLANIPLVLLFTALAFVGTLGGTVLGVLAAGGSAAEGFVVGLGVLPKGDVELVILTLALENKLISPVLYSSLVAMAMALTFIAPLLFKRVVLSWHAVPAASPQVRRKPSRVYKRR